MSACHRYKICLYIVAQKYLATSITINLFYMSHIYQEHICPILNISGTPYIFVKIFFTEKYMQR